MDRYFNQTRQRPKEEYTSYKNKKMKFSNDYTNSGKYDNYKTPNDESYSYKRSDYDSLAHEDYYVY